MKKIVFISSNQIFGGSEKLWIETVLCYHEKYDIIVFVQYEHEIIELLKSKIKLYYFNKNKETLLSKIKNKCLNKSSDFKIILQRIKPDLIVFSLGEPFSLLTQFEIVGDFKYLTVNQLVSDYHWLSLKNSNYQRFSSVYNNSCANFFVSHENLYRFEQMMGKQVNGYVINNPVTLKVKECIKFPDYQNIYHIAFVGRFEFYHKGLDLLLLALKDEVWKYRNVRFNFYGEGPHQYILQKVIDDNNLNYCMVHPFEKDVTEIWSANHLLISTSRFEGKSISISEASYYGRATIATRVGGASEQIIDGKTGYLINEVSSESILQTLNKAWETRGKWEEMGIEARVEYLQTIHTDPVDDFASKLKFYSEL